MRVEHRACWYCHQRGHLRRDCPWRVTRPASPSSPWSDVQWSSSSGGHSGPPSDGEVDPTYVQYYRDMAVAPPAASECPFLGPLGSVCGYCPNCPAGLIMSDSDDESGPDGKRARQRRARRVLLRSAPSPLSYAAVAATPPRPSSSSSTPPPPSPAKSARKGPPRRAKQRG